MRFLWQLVCIFLAVSKLAQSVDRHRDAAMETKCSKWSKQSVSSLYKADCFQTPQGSCASVKWDWNHDEKKQIENDPTKDWKEKPHLFCFHQTEFELEQKEANGEVRPVLQPTGCPGHIPHFHLDTEKEPYILAKSFERIKFKCPKSSDKGEDQHCTCEIHKDPQKRPGGITRFYFLSSECFEDKKNNRSHTCCKNQSTSKLKCLALDLLTKTER
jgi:hypothetical protein